MKKIFFSRLKIKLDSTILGIYGIVYVFIMIQHLMFFNLICVHKLTHFAHWCDILKNPLGNTLNDH